MADDHREPDEQDLPMIEPAERESAQIMPGAEQAPEPAGDPTSLAQPDPFAAAGAEPLEQADPFAAAADEQIPQADPFEALAGAKPPEDPFAAAAARADADAKEDPFAVAQRTSSDQINNSLATRRERTKAIAGQTKKAHAHQLKQTMIPVLLVTATMLLILAVITLLAASGQGGAGTGDPREVRLAEEQWPWLKYAAMAAFPIAAILLLGAWMFHQDVQRAKKRLET